MPVATISALGSPPVLAGTASDEWGATINGVTLNGTRTYPAPASGVTRPLLFLPGGFTDLDVQLADADLLNIATFATFNVVAQDDPAGGYLIQTLAPRDADAGLWDGDGGTPGAGISPACTGSSDIGGPNDSKDIVEAYSLMQDYGLPATHLADGSLGGAIGFSSGALRGCCALRTGRFRPKAFAMRSGMLNVYKDWDSIATAEQNKMTAMIVGWTSLSATAFADLTPFEKKALHDRSPGEWAEELPKIPYLLIRAGSDATIPESTHEQFVSRLASHGHDVSYEVVTGAAHAFPATPQKLLSLHMMRRFFGVKLAR